MCGWKYGSLCGGSPTGCYGALHTNIRKMLVETGAKHSRIKTATGRSTQTLLMPGTTLIREWDERQHRVTVTPDGLYELNGQVFKSLSAAAHHITGTQWNGPKFFGLRDGKARGLNNERAAARATQARNAAHHVDGQRERV